MAEATGVSADFYARIERGVSLPGLRTLMSLSVALGVTVEALLGYPAASEQARSRQLAAPGDQLGCLVRDASPTTLRAIEAFLDTLKEILQPRCPEHEP